MKIKWRQFLTPVKSLNAEKARKLMEEEPELKILDVRQPKEYRAGHIAGAHLIPLGELLDRLPELEPEKPLLVYCAIGGRSRAAAQMLAGKGFPKVYNLSGGFKAFEGWVGFGDYEKGLDLFEGVDNQVSALVIAMSMEKGLRHFYQAQMEKSSSLEAKEAFERLAGFELAHEAIIAKKLSQLGKIKESVEHKLLEGGWTSQEFMDLLGIDPDSSEDILSFAMFIEGQALDLYSRAAQRNDQGLADFFNEMAQEEKKHLKQLGKMMENTLA